MWIILFIISVQAVVCATFAIPVVQLFWLQIQNVYYGLTTNERFGRDAIRIEETLATFRPNAENFSPRIQEVPIKVLEEEVFNDTSYTTHR
jgi:hypothetical protein